MILLPIMSPWIWFQILTVSTLPSGVDLPEDSHAGDISLQTVSVEGDQI